MYNNSVNFLLTDHKPAYYTTVSLLLQGKANTSLFCLASVVRRLNFPVLRSIQPREKIMKTNCFHGNVGKF